MFKLSITKPTGSAGVIAKGTSRLRTLSIPKGTSSLNPITTGARDVGTVTPPAPVKGSFIGRPLVTPAERARMNTPTLYNPAVLPTFNKRGTVVKDTEAYKTGLRTGLDYFNRYTETALGTLGAIAETAGYSLDKNTWGIFTDKMKEMYAQVWSPSALEEQDVPKAVGRAAGNTLSLLGTALVTWQIGTAVKQTAQQLQLNARRIAYAKSQLPKEGTVAGLESGGAGKVPSVKFSDLNATKWEEYSWTEYATKKLGMTPQQAHESLTLMKEVAASPYAKPGAVSYGSSARESGFALGQSYQPHVVSTITQTVEGLPAGQNIVLNFITENPSAAVRIGMVSNARAVTALANLAKAVNAGQATVAGLQTAMESSIPSLGTLAHYADLTREPLEKAMAEQFNLAVPVGKPTVTTPAKPVTALAEIPKAVPVGQPQTVSGGVKPAPRFHLALPTQATQQVAQPQISPAVALSERETSIAPPSSETAPQIAEETPTLSKMETTAPVEVPQVLYHGTNNTIEGDLRTVNKSINSTTFGDVETERHGIFLTDSKEFAEEYGKNVLPYRVSPDAYIVGIEMGAYPEDDPIIRDFIASLDPFGEEREIWQLAKYQKHLWGFFEGDLGKHFVSFLKERGYDGVRFEETSGNLDGGGKEITAQTTVILNPTVLATTTPQISPSAAISTGETSKHTAEVTTAPQGAQNEKPATSTAYNHTSGGRHVEMVPTDVLAKMVEFDRRTQPKSEVFTNAGSEYIAKLREDIRANGIKEPIFIDYNENTGVAFIGEGNTRVMIAKELGIKELPAVVVRSVSETPDTKHRVGVNAVQLQPWDYKNYPYLGSTVSPSAIGIESTTTAERSGLGIGKNDNQPSPFTKASPIPAEKPEVAPLSKMEPTPAPQGVAVQATPAQSSAVAPVKWGKWIEAVGSRRTDGVGTGKVDTIETPVTYRLGSGKAEFRYASGSNMIQWEKAEGKALQLKDDTHSYYLREVLHENPKYKTYTVTEGRSGLGIGRGDTAKNAIANAQETILAHKAELDTAIAGAVKKNQGEANPQYVVTNDAPLPPGFTSSGEAVTPSYTSNEPDLATSGTGRTIPASKDDIARITVAFDDVVKAKREGRLTKATEGTYQKMFLDALKAAGVPKGALGWKDAIQYYKQSKGEPSLESRLAKVAEAVEKYNAKVLGEKIVSIAHKREAKAAVKEAVALVKEQSEEQIAENGRILLEKAKKAVEGQKFGDQIMLAKQKAHSDAILAAMKQRAANQAKTMEWLKAEADRKARQKAETATLKRGINAVSMKATPAEEARGIQVATAGVKGAEKIFEKPSSTQFAFLAEEKGLHVEQRPERPEQREVDLPELRKIAARVKALRDLGLEKKDAITQARRESIEQRADAVTAQILTSIKPTVIPDIGKESHAQVRPNKVKEVIQWIADAKGRKVWQFQELDGFKRGVITQTLYDDAIAMENIVRSSDRLLSERIRERLDKNGITGKSYNAKRTLPNGQVLTQAQVLLVAVNSLNEDNLYHLMAGNGYSEETIAQAIRSMTKEEVDTANMILDEERGAWPAVNAAYEYTHNGESLPQLENFVHIELQHGDEIGQPEGTTAEELIHQDVIAQGWVQNATSKGWEKQRVPKSSIPLREDPIATFISYIKQTTDFIGRERTAQDILQIVKDVHVKDAYQLRSGHEGYSSLLDYAKDLANPAGALGLQAVAPKGRKFERILRNSRLASSCSILALRLSKMATAGASYVTSAGQVGLETMLYGTAKLVSNPRMGMRTIKELMPILYDRIIDPVRIEAEVSMLEKSWERGRSQLRDWENVTFRIADTADIASEALGELSRVQREHPEWSIEKSAYEVQRMVLSTHSSDIVEDKPDIYKLGEVARVITAFTGEATAAADYLNYLGRGAAKGKIPKHRFFRQLLFTIVGVALVMRFADKISQGRKDDPKADKWYKTWWGYSLLSLIENTIPILGRYITQGLQGITWASAPVALKPLEIVKNIFAAIAQGDMKDIAQSVAELAGYLTAAPVEGVSEAIRWLTPPKTTTQVGPTQLPSLPKRPSPSRPPRP